MLTEEEILRLIGQGETSPLKRQARLGQDYYEARHDILKSRMFYYNSDGILVEDRMRSNRRIPHPFFTELADQMTAYLLSGEGRHIISSSPELQKELDRSFDDRFWAEIAELLTGTYVKGSGYLYGYAGAEGVMTFRYADMLGVEEVRKRDTDLLPEYIIYHYDERDAAGKKITRVRVWSDAAVWFYRMTEGGPLTPDPEAAENPCPHVLLRDEKGTAYGMPLGRIPFWRLDYDACRRSGLAPIKNIIDDYDLMECGLSNNLADFDTPIYVVKGYYGNDLDQLQRNLRTRRIVGTDEDGGIEVMTAAIPYEARVAKLKEDEKNIYRFGMGFNSGQTGDGNITNVVIRSRYTLLDLKAGKLLRRLRSLLRELLVPVLGEINRRCGTAYTPEDVTLEFHPTVPTNESELSEKRLTEAKTRKTRAETLITLLPVLSEEETAILRQEILGEGACGDPRKGE